MVEFLRTLFALNQDLIYFVYGLTFFILGLAIALQSRHASRLDLARNLNWLAAFGFTHGLHEWGEYFIPIQAAYLSPDIVQWLHALRLLLLAISFACLFEFAVSLLSSLGLAKRLRYVPFGLCTVWIVLTFFPLRTLLGDMATWQNVVDAIARYFIGLPGGLLAAIALRRYAHERIAPLNVPRIFRTFRGAGIALVLYGLFGGLLPPPVPFFPGSVLNSVTFESALIIPVPLVRSLIGVGLAVTIIRGLEIFDVEVARTIESMEQQQILSAEHDRLARELHDGAIQKVYSAGLLLESARNQVHEPGPLAERLDRAVNVLEDAIHDLRQNLMALTDTPDDTPLPDRIRQAAEAPSIQSMVSVNINLELAPDDTLDPIRTEHIVAIVGEALANVVRHARASRVELYAARPSGRLDIRIRDNGVGIADDVDAGFGLRNMRDRARIINGELSIEHLDHGTEVRLSVPWREAE
jgi:signal transduction histidine kinase